MQQEITVIYNQPDADKYGAFGEEKAELGVMDEVDAVHKALVELGFAVRLLSLRPPLEQAIETLKGMEGLVAFNLFEGFDGWPETEALMAGALSSLRIRFTGCPSEALSLSLDKGKAKELLVSAGIDTARYQILTPATLSSFDIPYPCVVKPCREDASHGLSEESLVWEPDSLRKQVERMCSCYGGEAMVEEFIGGREFNVTVLGNDGSEVLPLSEIEYSLPGSLPRILTFAAKWEPESIYFKNTRAVCPVEVPFGLKTCIGDISRKAFKLLGCRGYARVDVRLDDHGRVNVLEVNPNPDISPGNGAARQALASGLTYAGFIRRIVDFAMERVEA
ncbi:MAG: hypothetical protein Q7T05_01930 [Dehalococcoidia bacterium]|nr:hypothetical protein [Dehalococcoidia bacterium]